MNEPVLYFDYAATTPVDDRVISVMVDCLGASGNFGNPASSSHSFGQKARLAVELAREQVAHLVGAQASQIIWTSGATESSNLALKGVAQERAKRQAAAGGRPGHIITSLIEHKATLDTARQLEEQGVDVTWLAPDSEGLISADAVSAALRDDTFLVSLMLVNNELGTVNDIAEIGRRVRGHGALLHVDAAQGAGKLPIDLSQLAVDLMSLSAHKIYGPKGIGALYVGPRAQQRVLAQIHGGGHECGLRSGTLATHQIAGMGAAFALAAEVLEEEAVEIQRLSDLLCDRLAEIPGVCINGSPTQRIAHTLSFTFTHNDLDVAALGESLAFSSTSACNSAKNLPSHVLLALGLSPQAASQTIRLSLGRFTREQDIARAADLIRASLIEPAFWAVAQAR
ncbi:MULTISPECIES: cysteine desulfurase family protein [Pseudomonas]|uniref:cysteine desulfurase n=2 Tax=Pseudomonas fragariae (ex Marin et al. 2024) TaxID=3080056 RepID=A0ABT3LGE9_9PSED|nr:MULTISPECIES: aminotransferase class V-fold PLP-dependent enzyme [Pseudomonas]MCW6055536.1 aminotransferase class V-fold PLP-dependent enzyme [Pseudomonas fragi]MDV0425609.1 aminotransferase class V-fold PLP-dependent enzyme [Pseudomonas sp. 17]MDX9569755.1 aminotransferase class V-fold PLP-dependent enzyme [Pseudomonas sp. 21(2023)]MDX9587183.1 aminotransferase class V-fold PLP-dependent enzyme [Pseudomonas sp. 19(2023)]MDX9623325.1 aminotransferase class V-fold PLP-dependent enzyme [Pseud